jgi:serine protease Do
MLAAVNILSQKTNMKRLKPNTACLLAAAVMASAQPAVSKDSPALTLARQLNEAFVEVADQVSPAVVVIYIRQKVSDKDADDNGSFWDIVPQLRRHLEGEGKSHQHWIEGEGSGVIMTADGYILTNNHVVENADEIEVRLKDGRKFRGEVKGADPASDIAVVKINATGLKPAKLGDSDATRVGEFVLAIGAPFELDDTVTVGHVSAKGRVFEHDADQDFLQTDARILPGNSGGPLVNLYGEVIGINTMIEGLDTGIGFAVPINLAKRVKDHLITEGKYVRSWLGIGINELKNESDYLGLDGFLAPDVHDGVLVTAIWLGGPASKSELQAGDVITGVDGKSVLTVRQLKDEVANKTPGHASTLDVVRGKSHVTVKITPGVMPSADDLAAESRRAQSAVQPVELGLTVRSLTKELARQYGVAATNGVVVTGVEQNSAAEARGIKTGDVITEINRKRIATTRQFRDAVKSADAKQGLTVNVISDGESRFIVLKDIAAN